MLTAIGIIFLALATVAAIGLLFVGFTALMIRVIEGK